MTSQDLYVKTHVARDLLQSASLFKSDHLVIWEYVSNGLQYVEPGTNPVVSVTIQPRKKRIVIEDNGSGMDWRGLQNFFIMHGENLERKRGRVGRGRFGTGKSAAFGIANTLRVTSVRNKKRSTVELSRHDIDSMRSEDPVPVRIIEREVQTKAQNGTVVEIDDIQISKLDKGRVIKYVERHLSRWPKSARVVVNGIECEYNEPPVSVTRSFHPEGRLRSILGNVVLTIKVSMAPLDEDLRGVSIYANGVWYETSLVGSEGRDMAQYIFGDIDVPALDNDNSPIAPYDLSRSMQLNPANPTVSAIYQFVGPKVDAVRRELVKAEKQRRQEEEARRLAEQATEIAQVINDDFNDFRDRLSKVRARASGGLDAATGLEQSGGDEGAGAFVFGGDQPADIVLEEGAPGVEGENAHGGDEPRMLSPIVEPGGPESTGRGRHAQRDSRRRTGGGFSVRFEHMGEASHRAMYQRDERAIYINLDHPLLDAARGVGGIDDQAFRRLSYEVAFAEYSIALSSERAAHDDYLDFDEPITDVRETIDRVSRRAAWLYTD